ncbi:MAG: CoA transferase, partial [Acidimicrobiia bacterium]
ERSAPALRCTPVAGAAPPPGSCQGLVVVDLSSLWAGPLCGHLLQLAGARVIKVESETRPDGARAGPPAFFDLLHAGQEAVALDFGSAPGRTRLRRLLAAADVVIEASRPRALAQLDAGPEQVLPAGRPRLWVSITGYGRGETAGRRVAFGDDAAAAGGLVVWDGDGPCFCADALGDPAAGLFAAAGALAALRTGGRWILDVTMSGAAAFLAGSSPPTPFDGRTTRPLTAAAPRARHRTGRAAPPGRDTEEVMRELCPGC